MLPNKKEFLSHLILNKLQNTTFFNKEQLNICLLFVLNQWRDLNEDERFDLIDYVVSRLTGVDVNELYTKDDKAVKEKYLAHLLDLSGKVDKKKVETYQRIQILKGTDPKPLYPIPNDLIILQKKLDIVHGYWGVDRHEFQEIDQNWRNLFANLNEGIITRDSPPKFDYIAYVVSRFKCTHVVLEGWSVSEFLPLRIRALFEMVVKKEYENLCEPNLNIENQIPLLKRELICELETLQIYKLMIDIKERPRTLETSILIRNLVKSIIAHVNQLTVNQELTLPVMWNSHAIYVNFINKEQGVDIRVDNLGLGCIKINEVDGKEYHALIDGKRSPSPVSGEQISLLYVESLINLSINHMRDRQNEITNESDFKGIYHYLPASFSRSQEGIRSLSFLPQTVGNCVVAGHQVGLRSRLGSDGFLEEVLIEERIILMRLFGRERSKNIDCFELSSDVYLKPMDFFNKQVKKIYAAFQVQPPTLRSLPLDQLTFNMVATDYWYTDQDINRLMQSMQQENAICLPALLATYLGLNRKELEKVLTHEKQKRQNDPNSFKRIFFPINISLYQSQWVLLMADFDEKSYQPSFLYFDPMGRDGDETLKQVLQSIWPSALLKPFSQISISEEGDSTGLWIVEAVRELSKNKEKNKSLKGLEKLDRLQIRQEQMTVLGKSPAATQSNHQPAQDVVKTWLKQKNKTGLWISGPAGYGKSQFCNFLVTQDMSPLLRSGEIFFWISLRHVRENLVAFGQTPQEDKEILRILIDMIITSMNLSVLPWWKQYVLVHILINKPVIWMFDGYDELSQEEQRYFLKLINLFGKQDPNFSNHRCVVTTRPQFILPADMPSMQFEQLASLSFEGTINYIEKFFENDQQKGRNLEQFLRSRPAWQQLIAIPFNLQLLSNIWSQNRDLESLAINTTTELYLAVFQSMLQHAYVKKFRVQPDLRPTLLTGHYKYAIRTMEQLAYTLMNQKTLSAEVSFDKEIESDINEIGFLCLNGSRVEYLHKTFCEFMCASYIAKNIHKDPRVRQFISDNKYDPYFSKIWPFVAGLVYSLKKGHQPLFWNVLLAKPWEIGVQHVSLVLNCLEESQLNEGVPQHAELRNFILTCWEKVKDWAKSALSCISVMTLLEKTLFAFFASSPYVFEKILKDPFYELLTTMNDPVALLKTMNYQNLPDELVDKLLLKMNDGDVRISKILLFSNISRVKIHELIDNIQRWQARYPQLNESLPKASLYNKTLDRENRYLEFSRSLVHLLIKFASNFESALEYLMI